MVPFDILSRFTASVELRARAAHRAYELYERLTTRRVRVAAQLLLLAGLVFLLLRLRSLWRDSNVHLSHVAWWWFIPATAAALCAVAISGWIWMRLLRWLGTDAPRATIGVFLQAQLGKYVPGSVWQYAGRAALSRAYSLPMRVVAKSLPIELAASVVAAAVFAFLLLGWWGIAAIVAVLAIAGTFATALIGQRTATALALRTSVLYAGTWPFIGIAFWLTAHALVQSPWHDIATYTGAFSVAWLAGLVAIYAPGGIGVREAVLVALLRGRLGSADALVVAISSRGVFMLTDLVGAGISSATLSRRRTRSPSPSRST